MKDILTYILDKFLDEKVEVSEEEVDGFVTLKITAPQSQMGKIIGKGGKTINAMKNLLKIKAIKEGTKIDIQVTEAQS